MQDMSGAVGDVNRLRQERDARNNPPEYDIGQGGDEDWASVFSDSGNSVSDSDFFGSQGSSSSDLNALQSGSNNSLPGLQGQQNAQDQLKSYTAVEDKWIGIFVSACKVVYSGIKELFTGILGGLKGNDAAYWAKYGARVIKVSIAVASGGILLSLLGLFSGGRLRNGYWVACGGLLSFIIGLVVFSINCEKGKKLLKEDDDSEDSVMDDNSVDIFSDDEDDSLDDGFNWGEDGGDEDDDGTLDWGSFGGEDDTEDDDYNPWGNLSIDDEVTESAGVYEENINIEDAINNIDDIPAHTQTRQFLFEQYSKVLPLINPKFSEFKVISEDSDNFIIFDEILRSASEQVGMSEEKIPKLVELRENQFIIQLKATRPSGLKEQDIAREISDIYSKDDYGAITHEGVYSTVSSVGQYYIVNIFKGENSIVSLADTYRYVKDYILDIKNNKPIVAGVNELGKVWTFDADKIISYIISGKPRSGKSWTAVSFVVQLCMYSSPREVIFEALDVKAGTSDYYAMRDTLPHFRRFESDPKKIMSRLRYLTTTEASKREKILKDNDCIAIADLKAKCPDVDIPYLYVIIDEIVGLKGKLSKEEDSEFKELVNVLITQMPNLGIKVILVPHRVTNDIIPKTSYTLVGFMACVGAEDGEIKNTLNVTSKDFPYTLVNKGDTALKTNEINKGKTVFCHGIGITSDNDLNKDVYRFIGALWRRLEPEYCNTEGGVREVKNVEQYKGHNLGKASDIVDDEDFLLDDDSEYIDIFSDILGDD